MKSGHEKISLAERLQCGFLSVDELMELKCCGRTTIYLDIKSGALKVEKHGKSTRIAGPVAAAYRPGARHLKG